jgi:serine/threonine protein kinase
LHLDLKPDNIILKKDGDSDELVLIDFATDGRVGTPEYIAPERESTQKHTPMMDFFSLGQTFVHLATGCHPEIFRDGGNWAASTSFPSSPMIEAIDWMIEEDPLKRPQTAYQVLYAIDILSKPKSNASPCTHKDAIDLIKQIRNELQEDEGLQLRIQESDCQVEELRKSNRIETNRLSNVYRILNIFKRRFNRFQRIFIGAIIGGIIALILAASMSKVYIDSQDLLKAEKKNLIKIENLTKIEKGSLISKIIELKKEVKKISEFVN